MKKQSFLLFIALTIIITVTAGLLLTGSAAAPTNGATFEAGCYYETPTRNIQLPSTYEATVYFPSTQTGKGGVIFGSYNGEKKEFFNFEIAENGAPRLNISIKDADFTNFDVTFTDVNVFNDKVTHVAVTIDEKAGTWKCYVDGQLKQTITKAVPAAFPVVFKFRLGGDMTIQNENYFKGIIQKFALYKDVRTDAEIASDATATKFDEDNAICLHDLTALTTDKKAEKIKSLVAGGIDFTYNEVWLNDVTPPENYAYSFAALGDIQTLTTYYPDKLPTLFEWIKNNAESHKIKFCIGLGDITDTNDPKEYQLVNDVYAKIKGVVPYSIIRGNHDRNGIGPEAATNYNTYITQAIHGSEITGSYDNTMLNTYRILQVGDVKYMFLNLDILMENEVIAWANKIISENKDCRVIVSTHIYMNYKGAYYALEGSSGIGTKYGVQNASQAVWEKLISQHENIIMFMCGHNPTNLVFKRTKVGVHGNVVTEVLVDPQQIDHDYKGAGLIAMFYFSADGRHVDVRYYSPVRDQYFLRTNQMSFDLHLPGDPPVAAETTATPSTTKTPETTKPVTTGNTITTIPETTGTVTAPDSDNKIDDTKKDDGNIVLIIEIIVIAIAAIGGVVGVVYFTKKK